MSYKLIILQPELYLMVHIGYFIDDICLPPADLTGTCHGISFYGFTVYCIIQYRGL